MTSEVATLPEKDEDALRDLERLKAFEIKTNDDYREIDALCVRAGERIKAGEKLYREHIDSAHKTWKGLLAKLAAFNGPSEDIRRVGKGKLWDWDELQKAAQRKKEAELQKQAQKLAEEQALADAEMAEEAGDHEQAKAILEQPVQAAPVSVPKATPKAATAVRRIPDLEKIRVAVANGVRTIPGVKIEAKWEAKVIDAAMVPESYRRTA